MFSTKKNIYIAILVVLSISAILCVMHDGGYRNNVHLYQMPLLCMFCFIVFGNIQKTLDSLSILIISIVCLIRYGVYPITISLENSTGSLYVDYAQEAFYLMLYEMVVILFFINIYSTRLLNAKKNKNVKPIDCQLTLINRLLLYLTIPIALAFPSLLGMFRFLGVVKSNVPISGVFSILFKIGLYIGYLVILTKCSRDGRGRFIHLLTALAITVLFVFMISIGETSVSRWSFLWIGIPSLIILSSLFPHYKKSIVVFACLAIPISIIVGSFLKFAVSDYSIGSFFSNFINSNMLSEYFGGLNGLTYSMQNVAVDARVATSYSTLTDLFCGAPLLSAFFDFENYSTQSIYLHFLGRRDLICPLLGQSYAHFGFWGAPIFSILMVMLAVEFNRISQNAKDVYLKYVGCYLCVIFSLFMCLNTIIIFSHAWTLIIFLLIQLYNNKNKCGYVINYRSCL